MKLRLKWTAAILVVTVVPLALVGVAVDKIQRNGLATVEADLELAIADQAAREISGELDHAQQVVHRTAVILSTARGGEDDRLLYARETIGGAEIVDWVSVFAKDASFIGSIEKPAAAASAPQLKLAPKPATTLGRATGVEQPTWIRAGEDHIEPRFAEPLIVDGNVTGYVLGAVHMDRLDRIVSDLSVARFGRADRIVIVDADRRVVSAGASAGGDITTKRSRGATLSSDALPPAFGAGAFHSALDMRHTWVSTTDGTKMIGTVRTLPSQRWAVVVERPEAEAFQTLGASQRAFFFSALAIAALALVAGSVFARRITQPIQKLVSLTRAYAARKFDVRSSVTSATTNDEVGELGDALESMAADLASTEAEVARRTKVEAGLSRYLPSEVAAAVAAGEGDQDAASMLASRRAAVTVLFADVAAFTPFAERARPEDVAALLNELFTLLSEIVFRHGGMVDKFIGDCIMAVFGTGGGDDQQKHVMSALAAAEDMQRFVEASAGRWRSRFDIEVKLGIGIATGETLVGNLGSDRRMEFTTIGDSVNVASRLEGIAAPGQILVTSAVANANEKEESAPFELRSLGTHALRGKSAPVEVFELVR